MELTRRHFALASASALGLALPGRAWGSAPASARRIAVTDPGHGARVTVALDRMVEPRMLFLAGPDRFVLDFPQTRWALSATSGAGPGAGVVDRYRYAPRPDGSARLVLDLNSPARLVSQGLSRRGGSELTFDLAPSSSPAQRTPPVITTPERTRSRRRVVVIDPGHGGQDPGAIGATGVREKDVVLDAGLKLRDALQAQGRYQVAMTRDSDRFVPLPDRVAFARSHDADLFISLHADSHANPDAFGASIYTLSERGAYRAQTMASAQNWDVGAPARGGVLHDIFMDLTQRDTSNQSARFAETEIQQLGRVSPLLSNTHRSAGFFVLLAPDVPAVLIETGFLSNVSDERRLSDPRQREAIAAATAAAVDDFFATPTIYAGA